MAGLRGWAHVVATAPPERRLADLADCQHGVVNRRQLGAIGFSPTMVRDRLQRGSLVRLHRGVYAVGHRRLRPQD
ncbi:type IV toxin-antitoxin system AbiEi family antitoxin domain-containing protein [Conexibacter sp. CPCC 206217]|uniref:type IV toxin-antitoxin system AbiEi family antitoxin domain-containing protein n=1 Tax=Conexibacter sp. CPCC 206217 TaxID=3064574 RepID=UPI0027233AE9|nr:type IV toxin-antitoxin system AbiEi family antitoxin domain-containing protein [Conexibacter sp. CPCC 206217]MDO8209520.1 type IV toxin-antitoxin system AbiEi family antitoxin domain-containing protein [Conexibacter sp. CPCC 206217]